MGIIVFPFALIVIPISPSISYYESGSKQKLEFYSKKGAKIKEENYYSSGALQSRIFFQNELKDGDASFFSEKGELKEIKKYSKGKVVQIDIYKYEKKPWIEWTLENSEIKSINNLRVRR